MPRGKTAGRGLAGEPGTAALQMSLSLLPHEKGASKF